MFISCTTSGRDLPPSKNFCAYRQRVATPQRPGHAACSRKPGTEAPDIFPEIRTGKDIKEEAHLNCILSFQMTRRKAFLFFLHKKYVSSAYDRLGAGRKEDFFFLKYIESEVPVLALLKVLPVP